MRLLLGMAVEHYIGTRHNFCDVFRIAFTQAAIGDVSVSFKNAATASSLQSGTTEEWRGRSMKASTTTSSK